MSKIVLDTNIMVYSKDRSSKFHKFSFDFINSENDLFITSKNLTEYFAVVTKGEAPLLTADEALKDIEEFVSIAQLIFPSKNSHEKLNELTLKYKPKGLKIHDFEITAIALSNGISKIATFNRIDFQKINEIEIIVPGA